MKLYHTPTSPFVRKVLVMAHEAGVADRIDTVFLRPSPMQTDPTLSRDNPLSKIPTLVLDDGSTLYDSPVICEYLDSLHTGPKLLPEGTDRWRVLRVQALCDGILDAAILVFYERANRPTAMQWPDWLHGQSAKATQGLDVLEHEAKHFGPTVDLAQVAAGAALGWLEFRNVLGDIRTGRPTLFGWYDAFCKRPSMVATAPRG